MKFILALALVVLVALVRLSEANDYYKKPLEIKHVWTKHDYGHGGNGYGHGAGGDKYGHNDGYGHGKTLVGYSRVYHIQHHGYGHGNGGNHY